MTHTPPTPARQRSFPWGILAVGLIIVLGIIWFNESGASDPSPAEYRLTAQRACENAVEQNLKAPSTAKYNSTATGTGPWRVVGTVDAQNGFGAMIRSEYECTVRLDEDGKTLRARLEMLE